MFRVKNLKQSPEVRRMIPKEKMVSTMDLCVMSARQLFKTRAFIPGTKILQHSEKAEPERWGTAVASNMCFVQTVFLSAPRFLMVQ